MRERRSGVGCALITLIGARHGLSRRRKRRTHGETTSEVGRAVAGRGAGSGVRRLALAGRGSFATPLAAGCGVVVAPRGVGRLALVRRGSFAAPSRGRTGGLRLDLRGLQLVAHLLRRPVDERDLAGLQDAAHVLDVRGGEDVMDAVAGQVGRVGQALGEARVGPGDGRVRPRRVVHRVRGRAEAGRNAEQERSDAVSSSNAGRRGRRRRWRSTLSAAGLPGRESRAWHPCGRIGWPEFALADETRRGSGRRLPHLRRANNR